ncbi:cytochrome P450 [Chlamydoabsidia padenii]|nr:cytochrome P450 [Chlamydoabsidia padenii]
MLFLTLGATVALVSRLVYRLFYVPKSLRHLPCVNYYSFARSIVKNEDAVTRVRTVYNLAMKKGNGIFVANFPVNWTVYVAEPMAAKAVLMKKDKFTKCIDIVHELGMGNPIVRFFGVSNVGFVDGDVWKNQRKVMNPAFRKSMPIHMFGDLMQRSFKNIEQDGYQVQVGEFFQRITLDAIGIAGFGFNFGAVDDRHSVWNKTYNVIRDGIKNPLLVMFPRFEWLLKHITPGRAQLDKSVDKINALLMDMAKQKRDQLDGSVDNSVPEHDKDLLTLMLEAELRGEGTTSDEELRANLAAFFMAGHETTANTMSFCVYALATHQDIQEKARAEVLCVLGDEPEDKLPTSDDLRQLTYMEMVLKENLRRYGPASMLLPRISDEDTDLNGTLIPKNTPIVIEIDALHYNPQVWKNPEHFDPERFAPNGENQTSFNGSAWLPFSTGHRICIGLNFSMAQQRTLLAMLLRKYTWTLPENSPHKNGIQIGSFQNSAPESLVIEFHPRY